jgi:hypothetical protein
MDGTVRLQPSARGSVAFRYVGNFFHGTGPRVNAHLLAPELRIALNPRLQSTAFYQYNNSTRQGALNARVSWEFTPLSYLYVVWNDQRAVGAQPGESLPAATRQLVVKGTWLLQL